MLRLVRNPFFAVGAACALGVLASTAIQAVTLPASCKWDCHGNADCNQSSNEIMAAICDPPGGPKAPVGTACGPSCTGNRRSFCIQSALPTTCNQNGGAGGCGNYQTGTCNGNGGCGTLVAPPPNPDGSAQTCPLLKCT